MNVHSHPVAKRSTSDTGSSTVAGGAQPPYDGDMENRVAKLEEFAIDTGQRLVRIESRLEGMDSRMATKADLGELRADVHKGYADLIKWMVGTAVLLGATGITAITFVLAYGVMPRVSAVSSAATPAQPPQPIIIQLPAQVA